MTSGDFSNTHFLTFAEVAQVMRSPQTTVYRPVQAPEISAVRFGRSFRVPESATGDYVHQSALSTRPKST